MFVEAVRKVNQAVFPIFRQEFIAENQISTGVAGTGFFVSPEGHFISVAHVFDISNPQVTYDYKGLLPDSVHNPALQITEIARDNEHDLFLGKVDLSTPVFLTLTPSLAEVGKTVCITGYPLAQISVNQQGGLELGGVRRYLQPSFVLDRANMHMNGVTHDGFLVRDIGLFGMSGGPVFDTAGDVWGMQASVTDPRVSTNGVRTLSVENTLAIRSNLILDFIRETHLPVF